MRLNFVRWSILLYLFANLAQTTACRVKSPCSGGDLSCGILATLLYTKVPISRFVYSNNQAASVSMYRVNMTTGIPDSIGSVPSPAGGALNGIVVEPMGRFAYATDSPNNVVAMFRIDQTTGVLTALSPATVAAGGNNPLGITADRSGRFIYVGTQVATIGISVFEINQTTGQLTQRGQTTTTTPTHLTVDPTNTNLYLGASAVVRYIIDQNTGFLSSPSSATSPAPNDVYVDPTQRFVYAGNNAGTVEMFRRDQTGALTTITTAVSTGTTPCCQLASDLSGNFLYAVGQSPSQINMYGIGSNGALTPLATPTLLTGGSTANATAAEATGRFLYVANTGSANIAAFSINPVSGQLTLLGTVPSGTSPNGLAVYSTMIY
ncbi:MAG: beta-propeller fold lactonase family protein [Leptospirales bacterium]|nr:beta-propeller fold lactonase family protein [Leptospirales bacterium]